MAASPQLGLFGAADIEETPPNLDELPGIDADRDLDARLPEGLSYGTSTWTCPGWIGVVYPGRPSERSLVENGLRTYARHPLFRTVGIDSAYYNPIKDEQWRRYSDQLPDEFRCVMKSWNAITTRVDPISLAPNPRHLDAGLFCDRVLPPIARSFAEHIGPIVLEFPPIPFAALPSSAQFVDELHLFLEQLPREFQYAVELRNRELLTHEYLRLLRHHGVGHVLNLWERMPWIHEQMQLADVLTAPFVVSRLLLRPGTRHEEMKAVYSPFHRIGSIDETTRRDMTALASTCVRTGRPLYVLVGNKVEGCAPLTIRGLIERVVR